MEKYFSGEKFTHEEIIKGVYTAVKAGDISPVYCGSGYTLEGIDQLLNGISKYAPGANETIPLPATCNGEVIQLSVDENGPLAALMRFLSAFLNFFTKLIKGELSLDLFK